MPICSGENVLSFSVSLLLFRTQAEHLQAGREREAVSMATWKGHLQEVVWERVQNASWIIRLAVMTDNRPQLIRGRVRETGGRHPGRLLVIGQRKK